MTEGATRPRPAPPRKPDSLALQWTRWDDPPPPAPEPSRPIHAPSVLQDFGGFAPYTPPAPIRSERVPVARRPASVVMTRQAMPVSTLARRPRSLGASEQVSWPLVAPVPRRLQVGTLGTLPRAHYNMPSSRSDYQLQRPGITSNGYGAVPPSTSRRFSLPGGGALNPPKPSATYHGGLNHLAVGGGMGHVGALGSLSALGTLGTLGAPGTPGTPAAVHDAVRLLLQQPRNGFPIMDHKLSLFIEILDAQEKFSQVGACICCGCALSPLAMIIINDWS
ncbi:hypothetical protein O0L34_g3259 [Tuta absoluta]|nr:hypothetical protein O0L34_g3259 [Tuta absoluta]